MVGGPYPREHGEPLQLLPTPGSVSTTRPVGASARPTMDMPGQNVVPANMPGQIVVPVSKGSGSQ
jgi:hypothetical protein